MGAGGDGGHDVSGDGGGGMEADESGSDGSRRKKGGGVGGTMVVGVAATGRPAQEEEAELNDVFVMNRPAEVSFRCKYLYGRSGYFGCIPGFHGQMDVDHSSRYSRKSGAEERGEAERCCGHETTCRLMVKVAVYTLRKSVLAMKRPPQTGFWFTQRELIARSVLVTSPGVMRGLMSVFRDDSSQAVS